MPGRARTRASVSSFRRVRTASPRTSRHGREPQRSVRGRRARARGRASARVPAGGRRPDFARRNTSTETACVGGQEPWNAVSRRPSTETERSPRMPSSQWSRSRSRRRRRDALTAIPSEEEGGGHAAGDLERACARDRAVPRPRRRPPHAGPRRRRVPDARRALPVAPPRRTRRSRRRRARRAGARRGSARPLRAPRAGWPAARARGVRAMPARSAAARRRRGKAPRCRERSGPGHGVSQRGPGIEGLVSEGELQREAGQQEDDGDHRHPGVQGGLDTCLHREGSSTRLTRVRLVCEPGDQRSG